ncbi:MAG TPA: hypothetical protein VF515_06335 [Candidatus Binatia bacterium]
MGQTHVTKENYHGWSNTYRLSNGWLEAHVVTDIGPRIIDLRLPGGANLLQIREGLGGRGEATYVFRGGWRLWIAPERTETTYALDNAACQAAVVGKATLRVAAPPQPAAGIQKRIEVSLAPGEPRLRLVSHITNIADRPLTCAAWSVPVMQPGGRAFVPLDVGPPTAFDATRRLILWSYAKFADRRYQFGDRLIQIDSGNVRPPPPAPSGTVDQCEDVLREPQHERSQSPSNKGFSAHPELVEGSFQRKSTDSSGRAEDESKIGVDSAQGWAAYLLGGALFLKRFPHAAGQYPDGGATIEVYSNHGILELEHLGPLTTIAPGEEIVFPEDWWVFSGAHVPATEVEALAALQGYIARAPFP